MSTNLLLVKKVIHSAGEYSKKLGMLLAVELDFLWFHNQVESMYVEAKWLTDFRNLPRQNLRKNANPYVPQNRDVD